MIPSPVAELGESMAGEDYLLSDGLAVSLFLALRQSRPLFLEGEAGVGKAEVAKTLATLLDRCLIRLQCYEGLYIDAAAYEWNYARQMMQTQSAGQGQLSSVGMGSGWHNKCLAGWMSRLHGIQNEAEQPQGVFI